AEIRAARGDRAGADRDYAAFFTRWPNDPRAPDALMDRARLAMGAGDGDAARQHLDQFVARYPRHSQADDAIYLLADSHQDDRARGSGNAELALAVFDRLVRTRPGSRFADRAYLRAAHLLYSLGRYAEADARYRAYRGGESGREARYWAARTAEARGQRDRARTEFRALAGGSDYYALRARGRLAGRSPDEGLTARGYAPIPGRPDRGTGSVLLGTAAGRTAAALLALGERRYAHAELARALPRGDRAQLAAWAPALAGWGFPDLALQIGTRWGAAGEPAVYPLGFGAAIDGEARAHALDAAVVLALIRQESLFDAEAVSPVGARGLMQIMPATGREIADSLGWRGAIDPQLLFEPALSLHFGSRYMADQLARFEGFWPAVLAGYNGGPHNVARWMTFPERGQDAELWIDRIPYRETRNYVKHVYEQAAAYRRIYGSATAAR
ncbi:MAG: transglycosylase SLT domain-containing protein, partial [Gemmatimonadota bacterium]